MARYEDVHRNQRRDGQDSRAGFSACSALRTTHSGSPLDGGLARIGDRTAAHANIHDWSVCHAQPVSGNGSVHRKSAVAGLSRLATSLETAVARQPWDFFDCRELIEPQIRQI